jgi:predicted nucleic-acid-binding protein
MEALDTNVIIRFLVKDDPVQTTNVYNKFKTSEKNKEFLFIPLLVVLETIWVLESVYAVKRADILDSLANLMLMPILEFEKQPSIRSYINAAYETNNDLSDLLIAYSAKSSGCNAVLTFDKKAAKHNLFKLLSNEI